MNYVGREPVPSGVVLIGDTNPVGMVGWFHAVPPDGTYLQMNGQVVSKATYPDLWTYASAFLTGDQTANPGLYRDAGGGNFAVPKLDGLFIRAQGTFDANRVSAALGVRQDDTVGPHLHPLPNGNVMSNPGGLSIQGATGSAQYIQQTSLNTGTTETRPTNVALIPCVKALKTILVPSTSVPSGMVVQPTVQSFTTAGSANYTPTNPNVKWIKVRVVGGGGAGAGSGAGQVPGTAGGNSVFGPVTCPGGPNNQTAAGVATGIPANAGWFVQGTQAEFANASQFGGTGAGSFYGGGGSGGNGGGANGQAPLAWGAGGGGGWNAAGSSTGWGGSAGTYAEFWLAAAVYAYTVGAHGVGGAGTASTGGNGMRGAIFVEEYY